MLMCLKQRRTHRHVGKTPVTKTGNETDTGGLPLSQATALPDANPVPSARRVQCPSSLTDTYRHSRNPSKEYFFPSSHFPYCHISGLRCRCGSRTGEYMLIALMLLHPRPYYPATPYGHSKVWTIPPPILPRTPGSWAFCPRGPSYGMSRQKEY